MMKCVVVYTTKYGSTGKYAEYIGNLLKCPVIASEDVGDELLASAEVIIFGSCLLGGEMCGADQCQEWLKRYPDKQWIIYTVGLFNPNLTNFKEVLEQNFADDLIEGVPIFHLRGAIVYKRLLLTDRIFSKGQKEQIESLDAVPLGKAEHELLARFGTTIDEKDIAMVMPLIKWVQGYETSQFDQGGHGK
ncbi:flavodoxin domain-containing protein [Aerococcaceae bacterium NML190938]|nr:flavodoxin domain-containing protein [Aerococcaceae bacterium NML190938]